MSKHTLGPWHNQSTNCNYSSRYVCGPRHEDGGDFAPICIADTVENARLIATAPELLDALRKARGVILAADLEMEHPITVENIKLIDAVIAKAEGKL
jgi:hypothetical protein